MARENSGADNVGIITSLLTSTIDNFTCGGWAWLDNTSGDNAVFCHGRDNAASSFDGVTLVVTSGTISLIRNGIAYHDTSTSFGTGAWHHILLTRNSGTWKIYYDNTDIGPNNTDNPHDPTSHFGIGCQGEGGSVRFRNWDGKLAEIAFWERVLSAEEITALYRGFSPAFFKQNLIFYTPLVRDIIDFKQARTFTDASTTVADHPRIYYPSSGFLVPSPTVASGTLYERSNVDAVGLVDILSGTLSANRTNIDSIGLVDSLSHVATFNKALTDSQAIVDTLTTIQNANRSIADAEGITDELNYQRLLLATLVDAIGLTDTHSHIASYGRTQQDAIGLTDFITSVNQISRSIVEAVGLTDVLTGSVASIIVAQLMDDMGVTDTVARTLTFNRENTDYIGLLDQIEVAKQIIAAIVDVVGIEDVLDGVVTINASLVDAVGLADALSRVADYSTSLVEGITLEDVIGVVLTIRKQSVVKLEGIEDIKGKLESVRNK